MSENTKPDNIKNIIIGALSLLCALLVISLLTCGGKSQKQQGGIDISSASVSSSIGADSTKMDASALIRTGQMEGISLSSSSDEVDSAAKKANFSCEKQTPSDAEIIWNCKHSSLEETVLNIRSTNGKIVSISRSGGIDTSNVTPTLNAINDLHFLLNTRKGVSFNQNEDGINFSVINSTDKGEERLDIAVMNQRVFERPEPGQPMPRPDEMKKKTVYYGTISIPAEPVQPIPTAQPTTPPAPEAAPTPEQAAPAAEPAKEDVKEEAKEAPKKEDAKKEETKKEEVKKETKEAPKEEKKEAAPAPAEEEKAKE